MRHRHLDWPFFDDAHRALGASLENWAPAAIEDGADERTTCRALVAELAASGRLAPPDVRSLCLTRERLAHHHGLADFAFAMQGLGSTPIALFGTDAQSDAYVGPSRNGAKIAAFALSEPEAGSDVAAIATRAELEGDHFVLNGTKTWISNGGLADFYVVFARTDEAPGTKGLSALIVERDDPGFRVAATIEVVAPHPLATLAFENCEVPASRLIGERGQGFKVAMATLDRFRPSVGAAALGFARRALDESLTRVETREQFGQKLADFQLTQAKLASMATSIDAAALLVYRAAWLEDSGAERVTKESSMAKMYATEMAQRVIDDAVQLFGAAGVVKGNVTERLYREIRALRIYEGTTEIHKLIIARQLRKERTAR